MVVGTRKKKKERKKKKQKSARNSFRGKTLNDSFAILLLLFVFAYYDDNIHNTRLHWTGFFPCLPQDKISQQLKIETIFDCSIFEFPARLVSYLRDAMFYVYVYVNIHVQLRKSFLFSIIYSLNMQ